MGGVGSRFLASKREPGGEGVHMERTGLPSAAVSGDDLLHRAWIWPDRTGWLVCDDVVKSRLQKDTFTIVVSALLLTDRLLEVS